MGTEAIMSVSGVRGIAGETFTEETVASLAYVQTKTCGSGKILIGRDTRPSGAAFLSAAAAGVTAAGGTPVDLGIVPTPTVCVAVKEVRAAGGIILTASHNPSPYNGYKMVHAQGRLYTGDECERIYDAYRALLSDSDRPAFPTKAVPEKMDTAGAVHLEKVVSAVDADRIRNAAMSVAVDSVNGAAGVLFPQLLHMLGVRWQGVHTEPDGRFAHDPEPRPEHLTDLRELLRRDPELRGGFAFDPDGDRLALMGAGGRAVSEEYTLALALQDVLSRKRSTVATNLSTSMVVDDVANTYGCEVIRTKIGEAHVVEAMVANGCDIGGEGNGGIIYPRVSTVRDGLTGMALVLELMATSGMSITQLVAGLPAYCMRKEKLPCVSENPRQLLGRLASSVDAAHIDRRDGVKLTFEKSWVHVRASNTEPILRCYAEAETEPEAGNLVEMVKEKIC